MPNPCFFFRMISAGSRLRNARLKRYRFRKPLTFRRAGMRPENSATARSRNGNRVRTPASSDMHVTFGRSLSARVIFMSTYSNRSRWSRAARERVVARRNVEHGVAGERSEKIAIEDIGGGVGAQELEGKHPLHAAHVGAPDVAARFSHQARTDRQGRHGLDQGCAQRLRNRHGRPRRSCRWHSARCRRKARPHHRRPAACVTPCSAASRAQK